MQEINFKELKVTIISAQDLMEIRRLLLLLQLYTAENKKNQ